MQSVGIGFGTRHAEMRNYERCAGGERAESGLVAALLF
jgi:hypothetical protein